MSMVIVDGDPIPVKWIGGPILFEWIADPITVDRPKKKIRKYRTSLTKKKWRTKIYVRITLWNKYVRGKNLPARRGRVAPG